MDFDLKQLTDWARRASGDRARRVRETQVGTGSADIVLGNDGGIVVESVAVDSQAVASNGYQLSGNVITFGTAPPEASEIIIAYLVTKYTDAEIQQFIADAADAVGADTHVAWSINKVTCLLTVDPTLSPKAFTADHLGLDPRIRELIVYKVSVDMYADKANQAADRAITVKDGDTMIDTSKTSGASERALKRLQDRYGNALGVFRAESFKGQAGLVYREEVITWGNDPLWGNSA